jgi:uncharacterized protein (TIGR04255 family)
MPFLFPSTEHIPLRNPPLREVICQVRFPPILKIVDESPTRFQDAIREYFPNYRSDQEIHAEISPGQPVRSLQANPQTHRFADRDEVRTVSLGLDFFAVSTTQYAGWSPFAQVLRYVTEAIQNVYQITYSRRIGLRYINILNTKNTDTDLFDPDVLDMLRSELTFLLKSESIQEPYLGLTQLRAEQEEGKFTIRSGIIQEDNKPAFILDFDRFVEHDIELEIDDLLERCERYHADIYNAFRWCITQKSLAVFEPLE